MSRKLVAKPLNSSALQKSCSVAIIAFEERYACTMERMEPSTSAPRIIVPLRGSLKAFSGVGKPHDGCAPFVVCAGAGPVRTSHDGQFDCVEIVLPPWGPRMLLGERVVPTDGVVQLTELLAGKNKAPQESASGVSAWIDGRLDSEVWLPGREIRYACGRLRRSGGGVRVATIATEVGWSERHLSQRFIDATGIGPRRYARLIRFESALSAVRQRRPSLAEIAATCGYADQAHMTREFAEFASLSPAAVRSQGAGFG